MLLPDPPSEPAQAPRRATSPAPRASRAAVSLEPATAAPLAPPAPARPASAASPAEGPRPREPGAATLRPVRGRVVDAATGQPIAGAWVTWRLPPPALVEQLLPRAQAGDPGISDAEGRFTLERLPDDFAAHARVHAVAPGYAYRVEAAPLAEELELALTPAATLELVLDPPPPPGAETPPVQVRLEPFADELAPLTRALPPWGDQLERYWLRHLPAGRYRLRVDPQVSGQRAHELSLAPGEVRRLRIQRAPRVEASGVLLGPEGALSEAELVFVDLDTATSYRLQTSPSGTFRGELPLARYRARFVDGLSERALPGEHAPGRDLRLELGERGPPCELRLTRGGSPLRSDQLGLVRLDLAWGGDLIALAPAASQPGVFQAEAPAGDYALFEGPCFLAEVTLPPPTGSPPLELPRGSVELTLLLPAALRADEVVRGEVALLPVELHSTRRDLAERFFAAAALPFRLSPTRRTLRLPLGEEGVYRLRGESDLGPFRGTYELAPGGRLELDLR